ncbi:MAG: tyrosine-type recombinase/integrase [Streptosporangiales bacterium]|nr:tyrosine-type recombinase/integrase [Streptosporangiales bacterium]
MPNKKGRRQFGWVRKLPSGRHQASYIGRDGIRVTAPRTFNSKKEANGWLTLREAELLRGDVPVAQRGEVPFGPYAKEWIEQRPGLRLRTAYLYRWLLNAYLLPTFDGVNLVDLDAGSVRRWRATLLQRGVSATMVAKAYRLLRAIMMTAVDEDELIPRNPCRIRGAGTETPPERPVLTVSQVYALADEMPLRLRALILVATFASLRFGEAAALRRADLDVDGGTVHVRRAYSEIAGQGLVVGPPKSKAGVRKVALPASVLVDLREHLKKYVGRSADALLFTGAKGAALRRGNFNQLVRWRDAVARVGVPGLHFHDLRHTGNTLAADSGVSTKNLMARMGHDSERAALIYQHTTAKADRLIADVLDAQLRGERPTPGDGPADDDDDGEGSAGVPAARR